MKFNEIKEIIEKEKYVEYCIDKKNVKGYTYYVGLGVDKLDEAKKYYLKSEIFGNKYSEYCEFKVLNKNVILEIKFKTSNSNIFWNFWKNIKKDIDKWKV